MNSFSEYVRTRADELDLSIAFLRDWLTWPYAKVRAIKVGTLKAQQISLQEAVDLARVLHVTVDDLARAAGMEG